MLAFDIGVKTNNRLSEAAKRLVVPLQDLGKALAVQIRNRVGDGRDPEGNAFTPLGSKRGGMFGKSPGKNREWWVSPKDPQPAGWMFIIPMTARRFGGYAVYRDYDTFLSFSDGGNRRDFYKSGQYWASIRVRPQSVNRIKVISSGSRMVNGKRIKNRDIAYFAAVNEKFGPLTYSDEERRFAVAYVKSSIDEQMAIRLGQAGQLDRLNVRASRANKRATKLGSL